MSKGRCGKIVCHSRGNQTAAENATSRKLTARGCIMNTILYK